MLRAYSIQKTVGGAGKNGRGRDAGRARRRLDNPGWRWQNGSVEDLIQEHIVTSYECGADHLLKPECFMMFCQEMAERHAGSNGFGFDWGVGRNVIWVEVQANYEFLKRPRWKERVLMRTNTGAAGPIKARRFVEMTAPDGTVLARADLVWCLMDITTRGPVPPKKAGLALAEPCPAITAPLQRLEWAQDAAFGGAFPAPRRDTDFNGHINNSAYLIWVLEHDAAALPTGPFAIQIKFKKETMAGEAVQIAAAVQGDQRRYLIGADPLRAEVIIERRGEI